jgi:hypothetical protein
MSSTTDGQTAKNLLTLRHSAGIAVQEPRSQPGAGSSRPGSVRSSTDRSRGTSPGLCSSHQRHPDGHDEWHGHGRPRWGCCRRPSSTTPNSAPRVSPTATRILVHSVHGESLRLADQLGKPNKTSGTGGPHLMPPIKERARLLRTDGSGL